MAHRILLVEDNATARDALGILLVEQGYDISTAADGAAALSLLSSATYDLVITDMVMPKVGGIDLVRAMRADPQLNDVPVIIVSAQHDTFHRVEGLESGADDFVPKPIDIDELLARVRRLLARSEHHKELERQSVVDPLTGVFNRRGIANFFVREHERTSREGASLSLLVIDVDEFKSINDRFGHAIGDTVLCAIARGLQDTLRATDRVGRIGGDEFLAILPGASTEDLKELVERVRAASVTLEVGGELLRPQLSIGAVTTDSSEDLEELLTRADRLMYEDKRRQRRTA